MTDALVGQTIGRCRIERLLGAGGMGAVYQGTHEALRIPVAVKFLSLGGVGTSVDGAMAARFMREAQLAATLRHPNIVRIYDVNQDQGYYFIIMELLSGSNLTSLIEGQNAGRIAVEKVRDVGHQIAAALAHAHSRGVIHRDIKPDNVMLAPDGTAILTDFGIAAPNVPVPSGERLTRQGSVVGTPWYLAPEQARAGGEIDARADIYALGVMLYELLTGALPFDGDDATLQLVARLTMDPTPIQSRRPDLPPEVVTLIARMLARDPANRVQTAEEVAAALGGSAVDRTVAPPAAMTMTAEMQRVSARSSELTVMADSAGLPFATPPGAHLVELRMADIRATLRLAEEESTDGASLFMVHRPGEADVVGFVGKRVMLAMRVSQGVPRPLTLQEVLAGAMKRGEGALVVRKSEQSTVGGLRCWLEGQRVLGPLPAEILRPMGLFSRLRRSKSSGVLAMTDRGQTSVVIISDGKVRVLMAAPLHRAEIATETEGGIGVWLESCSPDALVMYALEIASAAESRVSLVPDDVLRAALTAAIEAAGVFAADASREFGLGSAQVFSKYLRESTAGLRDLVPVAALAGQKGPVDLALIWQTLASGATAGRDVVVRAVIEAILVGTLKAAAEILPPKKLPKTKQSALAGLMKAKPALDTLQLTPMLQQALAG